MQKKSVTKPKDTRNTYKELNCIKILILILSVTINYNNSHASIKVDGLLNEVEWETAQILNKLITVHPYTLAVPAYKTEVKIISSNKGLYFGITSYQPFGLRNNNKTPREQYISSDKVQIVIDFDGSSISAYSFEIGSSGSMRDGVYSNENSFSNEWDGAWESHVSNTKDYWIAEILIPWDIVSMQFSDSDKRKLKVYFSRSVADINTIYANVKTIDNRQLYLSKFASLSVDNYSKSSLQVFANSTFRDDLINSDTSTKYGLDLFWKTGKGKQLTATLNPDFGQIESDNLVVNFSANESFFSERRPFFTQNQSVFNISGANRLRLIHTRRIGGRPDSGVEPITDIDAAIKFTSNQEQSTYGIFAAFERSNINSKGRSYLAARFINRIDDKSFSIAGTYVNRPEINRSALTYAFGYDDIWANKYKIQSQFITSNINENNRTHKGYGGWTSIQQQINNNQEHQLILSHYDNELDINDFGFLPRNNLNTISYTQKIKYNDYDSLSRIQQHQFIFKFDYLKNNVGNTLGSSYTFFDSWQFKSTQSFNWDIKLYTKGVDDRISRENGLVNTGFGTRIGINYSSTSNKRFRIDGYLRKYDNYAVDSEYSLFIRPSYYFQDNYNLSVGVNYRYSNDWLNWLDKDLFGRYKRKLVNSTLEFNAIFSHKHELRLRFQWIGLNANANAQYQLNNNGNLEITHESINDFSISNTALQLRYKYEIKPLSNIYVVYTRGSKYSNEISENLFSLFDNGINQITSNNFLIKFRYQFL